MDKKIEELLIDSGQMLLRLRSRTKPHKNDWDDVNKLLGRIDKLLYPQPDTYTIAPLPSFGDLMTLETFTKAVRVGGFIDYDGSGYYATLTEYATNYHVKPSRLSSDKTPEWATHIIWFNR